MNFKVTHFPLLPGTVGNYQSRKRKLQKVYTAQEKHLCEDAYDLEVI